MIVNKNLVYKENFIKRNRTMTFNSDKTDKSLPLYVES